MLGDGRILVQRLGDILDGKRTWDKELRRSNVAPTLGDAVAGDITAAMPYRARLRRPRDPAVLARAEVLQQPREDGRGLPHERAGPALPGGLERLDARAHDGIRHGLFGGTFACRRLEQGKRARTPSA